MSKGPKAWSVLPHDPMEQLAENLWWVEGDLPNMSLRRCMTVARLKNGDLVLHSAMALDEAGMEELESLGRPAFLLVPNGWHRMDAPRYKTRYPDLQVLCPPSARKLVEKVVSVDATYNQHPHLSEVDDSVTLELFSDTKSMEGVMMVRSQDGLTAVFCDSLFNLPHQSGLFWFFYGRVLGSTGGPRVTKITRLFMGKTVRSSYKAWLAELAQRPELLRLIPGHGRVIQEDAAGVAMTLSDSL